MNAFDLGVCVLAAGLALYGLLRGLVRILVSWAALVLAFVVANRWHEGLAGRWEPAGVPAAAGRLLAWLALFVAVAAAGALLSWMAGRLLAAAHLGFADRLAGAAVGVVVAVLAAAALAVPLAAYGGEEVRLLRTSRVAPYVTAVSDWLEVAAPEGIASRYARASAALKRGWRDRPAGGASTRG